MRRAIPAYKALPGEITQLRIEGIHVHYEKKYRSNQSVSIFYQRNSHYLNFKSYTKQFLERNLTEEISTEK